MHPARKRLTAAIMIGVGLAAGVSPPVLAQEEKFETDSSFLLEEVIVTGTRIVTADGYGRTSPVTVVGMQEIESLGFTRVEDILNTLPQVQADQTSFESVAASGTATVNLRGLGANRTLVLVNGRRLQPGGVWTEDPDINQIPAAMIERVEVLTGGASATYGADAVAGVVNFIMRGVHGIELSTGVSGYQHDNDNAYIRSLLDQRGYDYPSGNTGLDGKGYFANLVAGGDFAGGAGNATIYINWRENAALLQGTRDYSSCSLNATGTRCTGSANAAIPNYFIAPLTESGAGPNGYDYNQEIFVTLQPDSSFAPFSGNLYNTDPVIYFMRPDERWSMGAFIDYEFKTGNVAYLELMAASDRTHSQIAESGTFFAAAYPLSLDNAYFPDAFRDSLVAAFPGEDEFGVYIGKRNVEGGARRDLLEHDSFRVVAGVRGSIGEDWDYDISYLHGQTTSSSSYLNDFYAPSIGIAVDSRLCEVAPGCIPYEVFTYQGVTSEAAQSLSETALAGANTSTDIIQAYATGDLGWGLAAGNVLAVAGYEYRRVEFERRSDAIYQQGLLIGRGEIPIPDVVGDYSVTEFFVEANVPLLADSAFAQNLSMDLAYRWSDYSASGSSSSYRAGLDWQSLDWLRLRTGYNRAVRTPNVNELHEPQVLLRDRFVDPCLGELPMYSFEQCARTGMSAAQYGNTPASTFFDFANTLNGGNPELEPEGAETITAGLVFSFGNSMRLSFDYWDIEIDGVVDTIEPSLAFDRCALFGQLCQLIMRNAAGDLFRGADGFIINTLLNLGELESSGVDVAWDWKINTDWTIGLIGSYYLERETTLVPGEDNSRFDCAGEVGASCAPTPHWRHVATATYESNGAWSAGFRWRYFGSVDYTGGPDTLAEDAFAAFNYVDLNATFRFMATHRLVIGINNIFDKEPPLVGATLNHNFNSAIPAAVYDPLGRYLFATLTLGW